MKPAFVIVLGVAVATGIAVVASKPKKNEASTKPPSPTGSQPAISTPSTTAAIPPQGVSAYTQKTSYVVALRCINEIADTQARKTQAEWLRNNGYPKTADAIDAFADGTLTAEALLDVARLEPQQVEHGTAKPPATMQPDTYGQSLLVDAPLDQLYSYASTSPSIPFVTAAARKLAEAGDLRAEQLTQHLADLSG